MDTQEYEIIANFLKQRSGLSLSADKQYLLESRLNPIVRKSNLSSLTDVVNRLHDPSAKDLQNAVIEAMTTNESFFFRDKTPFDHFNNVMMPALLERNASSRRIRVWCAAASSGQEPYSLAMCIRERQAKVVGWNVDILGTDISNNILDKAREAVFSQFEVQRGLAINLLLKYFTQTGDTWQLNSDIRSMVRWRNLNLLDSFGVLGKFDIIFCRNVLIYFDTDTKREILNRLAAATAPGGYLILGSAETVLGLSDYWQPVKNERGLYAVCHNPAVETSLPRVATKFGSVVNG